MTEELSAEEQSAMDRLCSYQPGFTDVRRPFEEMFGSGYYPSLHGWAMIKLDKGCVYENQLMADIERCVRETAASYQNTDKHSG